MGEHFFLDGSGFEPNQVELRRAGWAVVCGTIAEHGASMLLGQTTYGSLEARQADQTVPRAEHEALNVALEIALSHLNTEGTVVEVYTDCQVVHDGFQMGAKP